MAVRVFAKDSDREAYKVIASSPSVQNPFGN